MASMETTKVGKCILKYLRIGPRKARLVCNTIIRKPANEALFSLKYMNKKAARFVYQGLKSAIANATVLKLDPAKLYVAEAKADTGPLMKRFMARSMGRADRMVHRTTHITVIVRESGKPRFVSSTELVSKEVSMGPKGVEKKISKKVVKESKEKAKTSSKKKVGAKS